MAQTYAPAVIDMPMQAFLLALVGAIVLARFVVSWITFLAETFAFGGSSVSREGCRGVWFTYKLCLSAVEVFRGQGGKMGW